MNAVLVKSKEKHFLPTRMKFSFIVKNKCFVIDFEKKNYYAEKS